MVIVLTRNWWALAIRGVAAVIFGIIAFALPRVTLTALIFLFGAYAVVDGVFAIIAAVNASGKFKRWWALLLEGILGIIAGIIASVMPGITALVLLYLIAIWAVLTGGFEIGTAIRLRKEIPGEWLMVLSGIFSIVFGVLLALFPGPGAVAVVWWIGTYAMLFGALLLALAFRLRSWTRELSHHHREPHMA